MDQMTGLYISAILMVTSRLCYDLNKYQLKFYKISKRQLKLKQGKTAKIVSSQYLPTSMKFRGAPLFKLVKLPGLTAN